MTVSEILTKMFKYSNGNLDDTAHFLKVYLYAIAIGVLEKLPPDTQETLEIAAITHDIACPLCREKYGNTGHRHQEEEGPALVRGFLDGTGLPDETVERVAYLVGHHHTPEGVSGLDYQILLEADYLVNAEEKKYPVEETRRAMKELFRTAAGTAMLKSISGLD